MITQEQAKKLLAKKRLTGHEAGKLWVEDAFLENREQRALLTTKEIRYMKSLIKSNKDIEIYNSYIEIYQRAMMALKESEVLSLMIKSYSLDLALSIKEHLDREVSSWTRPSDLPSGSDSLGISSVILLSNIKKYLRRFMAFKVRMEDLSRETGIDFSYDIRAGLRAINYGLETYNFYAGAPGIKGEKISLDKVKPDRQILKDLQDIIYSIRDQEASDGQEA